MKKTFLILTLLICCFFAGCGNTTNSAEKPETILGTASESGEKYTLFIGLNDKDTSEQLISTKDAIKKANLICAKYAGGYTQLTAKGGWTDDEGSIVHENSLVYIIYDISEESLIYA